MRNSTQGCYTLNSKISHEPDSRPTTQCCDRVLELVRLNPSLFSRLWIIAKLRSPTTGVYSHPLSDEFGPLVVDAALRRMHRDVFADWLSLRLQEQERDLRLWLASLGRPREDSHRLLEDVADELKSLIPPDHLETEATLFCDDFRVALWLVCHTARGARQGSHLWRRHQLLPFAQEVH